MVQEVVSQLLLAEKDHKIGAGGLKIDSPGGSTRPAIFFCIFAVNR
jgi:hypothetical protein